MITEEIFKIYASKKREGSLGQQQKAYQMLCSRKMVTVKTLKTNNKTFVRALIKKSYGHDTRPAMFMFIGQAPKKGYCECPVGVSGLCSHTLSILLYLKHYNTKEEILELTCTQVIQKWHKRSKKGSITMVPLREIKIKSARSKGGNVVPADPENTPFKRDVLKMKIQEALKASNVKFEDHVYQTLSSVNLDYDTALSGYLKFKFNKKRQNSICMDHAYCISNENSLKIYKAVLSKKKFIY